MAGERQLPGLDLLGYWTTGSDGYGDQLSGNFRILSALVQANAISRTTSLPGTGTAGDVYIIPSGDANGNSIAIWDEEPLGTPGWFLITPSEGWLVHVNDEDAYVKFDGTGWTPLSTGGASSSTEIITETGTARTLTAADFATGKRLIRMDNANPNTLTVAAGLSVTEPVHVTQSAAGQTTIAPDTGVTLVSADGNLLLRVQHSMASIIPIAADTFLVVGDLTT